MVFLCMAAPPLMIQPLQLMYVFVLIVMAAPSQLTGRPVSRPLARAQAQTPGPVSEFISRQGANHGVNVGSWRPIYLSMKIFYISLSCISQPGRAVMLYSAMTGA